MYTHFYIKLLGIADTLHINRFICFIDSSILDKKINYREEEKKYLTLFISLEQTYCRFDC